jgi:nitrite reductase (NO-forming)
MQPRRRTWRRLGLWALALVACDARPPGTSDPYDPATMDFKSPPARITTARQTGAFAAGNALSMTAALKPLDPAPLKEVRLDTTHKIIEISPGVKFSAWTFGDQVPGPTIRARVGDKIRFTMTNRSDEAVPGVRVSAAPMMHSMDFHAAMVSPQDKYRSIAPGQTIEFEFTLNYPGIFMYHCGTPMVLEHIASGMYGAVVVEPRAGFPTKADREYVIIQSEFYAKPDPDKRTVDGVSLYVLDGARLRAAQPTHTVFNGVHNGMVKQPLPARAGERVRLYVLNVGPSKTSSFHVVGTIFDRVWIEGNPGNQSRGIQTVLLGSSNSATVEFMIPEDGAYIMVDHHFANASQGAMGLISTAARADGTEIEHHNLPASATPTELEAAQGKLNFESKCVACHSHGGSEPPTECWRAIPMLRRCSQGVQQPADAQPESLPRGDPAIHPVLQMGRRSAPRFAVLERSRPLTPRPTVRVASPRVRVAEVGRRARVSRPISHLPVLAAATGAWGLCRVS